EPLRAEFASGKMSFRLGEAQKLLTPLEPGHFLLEKAERPEALRKRAETDPAGLLEHLFKSLQKPLTAAELKELLAGIVPDDKWTSWWKKASADTRLASSGTKRPTYTWVASSQAADEAPRDAFGRTRGRDRLKMARKPASRSRPFAQVAARGVLATMHSARRDDPSLALEAALTLEKLGADVPDVDVSSFF